MSTCKLGLSALLLLFLVTWSWSQDAPQPPDSSSNQPAIVWSSMQEPVPAPAGDTGAAEVPPAQGGAQQSTERSPEEREQPTKQAPGQNPADEASPANAASTAAAARTLSGTVVLHGRNYVLRTSDNAEFVIDDQGKAKNFENQAVKITGTVDAATHIIHVQKIEPTV